MKNRLTALLLIIALLIPCFQISLASTRSDEVFDSITIYLSASKTATFDADTYDPKDSIMVTQVRLYKKTNGIWVLQGYLPVPTEEATNTILYSSSMNYSSYIGTGTYKIRATFTADGYSTSRDSNTVTY